MTQPDSGRGALLRAAAAAQALDVVAAMAAMAGATGALLSDGRWAGWYAVGGVLVLTVSVWLRLPRQADPDDPREAVYRADRIGRRLGFVDGVAGLGRFAGLRMLAAAVVLTAWQRRPSSTELIGPDLIWTTTAVAGLAALIAVEPFLLRVLRLPTPYAVRLPGQPVLPPRTRQPWTVAPAGLLATLLAAVFAAAGLPGWSVLVVAVTGAVPAAVVLVQVRRRRRIAGRVQRGLAAAVADQAPEFVLYTARPDDASYQLTMWLPYLRRSGRRFLIVTREELPAEALSPVTDVPVVCCRSAADLDLIMAASLRAAFYVNASSGNGALIRYHQLTHVYLGHGDSDKPPSYNPTHAMYDRIFAAGPAATRRYAEHGVVIDPAKFQLVGRPQVEAVHPREAGRAAERRAGAAPVILYAPTWRGHVTETALSSLDRAEAIVSALLDRGVEVIFRPHPFSYEDRTDAAVIRRVQELLAADAHRHGRHHRFGPAAETDLDAFGCMNAADAMISDVSSVVSDFLFSGKPFAMVAPAGAGRRTETDLDDFVSAYPVARAAHLVDHGLLRLPVVLDELCSPSTDSRAEVRAEVRADYLGDFPADGYAGVFVDAVGQVCDAPPPALTEVAETDDGSTGVSRDTLRRNLDSLARNLFSGIAAVVACGAAVGGAGLTGPVAAAAAAAVAIVTLTSARPTIDRTATSLEGPRSILLLSAVAALLEGAAGPVATAGAVVAAILAVGTVAVEPTVRDAWAYRGVIAYRLPGPAVAEDSRGPQLLALGSVVVAAIGWAAGWWSPLLWVWLGLVAVQILVAVRIADLARRRLAAATAAEQATPAVLARYGPQFCLYFASGIGARYQVGMWLPYLRRIGRPFVIVVRSLPMLEEIRELTRGTGIPLLYRPTLRSLEDVVVDSMKVAFYVNNAVRNTHLIERRELTHVWLNHGDSEKPACFNPVHAIYDRIFTAGQAGIDRYIRHGVRIPAEKFVVVGRPQTEQISGPRGPIATVDQPTVLYAPTWQGPYADSRVYSLPVGRQIVQALLDRGVRVIFRAHPFNHRFPAARQLLSDIETVLDADRQRTGRDHLWGPAAEEQCTVEDCFNASDAMIADVSAVISDYLASGKPYAVVSVGRSEQQLLAEAPAAAAGYPIADDLSDLDGVLDRLLVSDPAVADRERMRCYYLGEHRPGHAADAFLTAARDLMSEQGGE